MPELLTLRSSWRGAIGVDREARMIRGMVLAEAGPLKSGRGEFDEQALDQVAELINAAGGVDSHLGHGHVFGQDPGTFLGVLTDAVVDRSPKPARIRGNLTFSKAASMSPSGDLAAYVMQLADERPQSISSSLVLFADLETRPPLKRGGKNVDQLPLLRPLEVRGSDIVTRGDAVNRLLSADPEEVEEEEIEDTDVYDCWGARKRLLQTRLSVVRFR